MAQMTPHRKNAVFFAFFFLVGYQLFLFVFFETYAYRARVLHVRTVEKAVDILTRMIDDATGANFKNQMFAEGGAKGARFG